MERDCYIGLDKLTGLVFSGFILLLIESVLLLVLLNIMEH